MQYSIVNLSEVRENSDFRIDAEYWKPELINMNKYIEHIKCYKLSEISQVITNGATPLRHDLTQGNIKFITPEFMSEFFINKVNKFILLKHHETELKRTQLKRGDILYCIKGRIGSVVPILKDLNNFNINQDVAKIRLKDGFNSIYIATFLNTKYGIIQSKRYQTGQINPFLGINNLQKINIPLLSQNFQSSIAELVNKSYTLRQSADTLYKEAEDILLEELGFKDYQIKNQKCFVKNLSDTQKVSRIDAEYFQPKYEDLIDKIKEYKGGYSSLDNIANIKSGSLVPDDLYSDDKSGIPYIRVRDLNFKGEINKENIVYLKNFTNTNETIAYTGDYIIATIGTVGKVGIVDNKLNRCIPSNNTSKISLKNKQNELFYLLLFQSFIFQQQIEKEFTQTAQPKILDNQLCNIIIPLLPDSIQSTISSKLRQSFLDRQKSLDLLAVAKGAVEVAIEDGEDVAFGYIDNNL